MSETEAGVNLEEQKAYDKSVVKEALKEWLDEKFMEFGKWSIAGLSAAGLVAVLWLILAAQGYHK